MGCCQTVLCPAPQTNIWYLYDEKQARFARTTLTEELELGKVEFFCGSGVGRDLTGVDWVGLVNLGAQKLLDSLSGAGEKTSLSGSAELDLVRTCFEAFREGGSPGDQRAVLTRFDGSFYKMVVSYAEAVDVCMVIASKAGFPSPKTYNIFISSYMSECHAKDICPGPLAIGIAAQILRQAQRNGLKQYSVYTTNYSRSINFALLELGVTVVEIYQARLGWASQSRTSSSYGGSVRIMRSVLQPATANKSVIVVTVFHMHGIAKALEEFVSPQAAGPSGRSTPAWSSQQHSWLGAAAGFFDDASNSFSLVDLWRSGSPEITRKGINDFQQRRPEEDPHELFEAVAEGIIISNAQYGCKEHVESLKGSFRAAIDDPGRTLVIVGSSMTDEFFKRFLEAGLDPNTEKPSADHVKDEALEDFDAGAPEGSTIVLCGKPMRKFMEGSDVEDALKPYLFFAVSCDKEGNPDLAAIQKFVEP